MSFGMRPENVRRTLGVRGRCPVCGRTGWRKTWGDGAQTWAHVKRDLTVIGFCSHPAPPAGAGE